MPLTNNLRKQVDLPVFEWMRFAPTVSSLSSSATASKTRCLHVEHGRYIYYMISSTGFWRYDTFSDSYQQLTSPPVALSLGSSMEFAPNDGMDSLVLSWTSTTVDIPAGNGNTYVGYDIEIIGGTGIGQRRTITAVSDPNIQDSGNISAIANSLGAMTITDSTKNWTINQYAGYQVRILSGTGVGQVRRILTNTATVLTLGDSTLKPFEVYAIPSIFSPVPTTASSVYQIESSTATIDSAWAVTPAANSIFRMCSGSVFVTTSMVSNYGLMQYDVATDVWYIRTVGNTVWNTVPTDFSIFKSDYSVSTWEKGTATSGTTTTLADTSKNWTVNQWAGKYLRITSGTGEDQIRVVASNTATTLTWGAAGTAPTTTSQYVIEGYDGGTATSGTVSSLTDTTKSWAIDRWKNYALRITGGTNKGRTVSIISNTATVLTTTPPLPAANAATDTYSIVPEDVVTFSLAANTALNFHYLDDDMPVPDRRVDSGVARQGYVQHGDRRAIGITSLVGNGTIVTCTTAINHNLKTGFVVNINGATGGGSPSATGFNETGAGKSITVTGATTFTYSNTTSGTATFILTPHSATTLTDYTKALAWTNNQWVGYLVTIVGAVTGATGGSTSQTLQIASNTATTLTFISGSAPTNGVSRYIITRRHTPGAMFTGLATGTQSTTQLADTTTNAGFTGGISGTTLTVTTLSSGVLGIGTLLSTTGGVASGTTITGMAANTYGGVGSYTVSISQTVAPSTVMLATGWATNVFIGRRVRIIGSTGIAQEALITANAPTTLTFSAVTTAPVTLVSSYAILQQGSRGVGIKLINNFGSSDSSQAGRKFFIARGGATSGFDALDIGSGRFEQLGNSPQTETLSTGSMYAYDRVDRIYFTKDATQRIYYLDLLTNRVHPAGAYPYVTGTATIGNRMEIYVTEDGLKYLWLNRHSNTECYRQLLFY